MSNFIVIADDLTGANATCSLLKKNGLATCSIVQLEKEDFESMDVLAYSTDSRGLSKKDAYLKVRSAAEKLKNENVLLYSKRIDSTLRGNIGAEIEGILDGLEDDRVAIVVPAFPDSERISIKGTLLVKGKLLENSDASKDPKTPIRTSEICKIIGEGLSKKIITIGLDEIAKGSYYLSDRIINYSKDFKVIVFDSVTNEDIMTIARGVEMSKIDIVAVDPGPFTMYLSRELLGRENKLNKVLLTVGSTSPTTKIQLEEILHKEEVCLAKANPINLLHHEDMIHERKRILEWIELNINNYNVFLITSSPLGDEKILNLSEIANKLGVCSEEISVRISKALASISHEVLMRFSNFAGVFSCGGDITVAILEKLKASGIEIKEEVVPLAAYGRIIGGDLPNFKIVSKGGMVGDKNCIKLCLNKIKEDI